MTFLFRKKSDEASKRRAIAQKAAADVEELIAINYPIERFIEKEWTSENGETWPAAAARDLRLKTVAELVSLIEAVLARGYYKGPEPADGKHLQRYFRGWAVLLHLAKKELAAPA